MEKWCWFRSSKMLKLLTLAEGTCPHYRGNGSETSQTLIFLPWMLSRHLYLLGPSAKGVKTSEFLTLVDFLAAKEMHL